MQQLRITARSPILFNLYIEDINGIIFDDLCDPILLQDETINHFLDDLFDLSHS